MKNLGELADGQGANDKGDDVSKAVDCQVFEDQLDALVRETLPPEGKRQLHLHATECPGCAMQLKVQEHLLGPSLEALEAQAPGDLVATVWAGVEEGIGVGPEAGRTLEITGGSRREEGVAGRRRSIGWLVPTLAAASLALLFSSGFLLKELNQGQIREAALAQQVSEQQRWFAELQTGSKVDPVARTASLAGRDPWMRALSRQENITIRGLQTLLARMPGDRTVLSRIQLDAILESRTPTRFRFLRNAVQGFDGAEGVSAAELLEALETLDQNDDLTVPTAELVALLS